MKIKINNLKINEKFFKGLKKKLIPFALVLCMTTSLNGCHFISETSETIVDEETSDLVNDKLLNSIMNKLREEYNIEISKEDFNNFIKLNKDYDILNVPLDKTAEMINEYLATHLKYSSWKNETIKILTQNGINVSEKEFDNYMSENYECGFMCPVQVLSLGLKEYLANSKNGNESNSKDNNKSSNNAFYIDEKKYFELLTANINDDGFNVNVDVITNLYYEISKSSDLNKLKVEETIKLLEKNILELNVKKELESHGITISNDLIIKKVNNHFKNKTFDAKAITSELITEELTKKVKDILIENNFVIDDNVFKNLLSNIKYDYNISFDQNVEILVSKYKGYFTLSAENIDEKVQEILEKNSKAGLVIDPVMIKSALFIVNIEYLSNEDIEKLSKDLNITEEIQNMYNYCSNVRTHNNHGKEYISLSDLAFDLEDREILDCIDLYYKNLISGVSNNSINNEDFQKHFSDMTNFFLDENGIGEHQYRGFSFTSGAGLLSEQYYLGLAEIYRRSEHLTDTNYLYIKKLVNGDENTPAILNGSKYLGAIITRNEICQSEMESSKTK